MFSNDTKATTFTITHTSHESQVTSYRYKSQVTIHVTIKYFTKNEFKILEAPLRPLSMRSVFRRALHILFCENNLEAGGSVLKHQVMLVILSNYLNYTIMSLCFANLFE